MVYRIQDENQVSTIINGTEVLRVNAAEASLRAGIELAFYNVGETEHGEIYRDNDYLYIDSGVGGDLYFKIAGALGGVWNATGLGIGINTPLKSLHVVLDDANQSGNLEIVRIERQTTGNPSNALNSFGGFINIMTEDSGHSMRDAARISGIATDVTAGTYTSAILFHTRTGGGGMTEQLRIEGDGTIDVQVGNAVEWYNAGGTEFGTIYRDNDYLYIDSGTGGTTKFYIAGVDVASLITNAFSLQEAAGDMYSNIYTYSATDGHMPSLDFFKSASDTLGTVAETGVGDYLGRLRFFGVNAAGPNAFAQGAQIYAIQMEAAGGTNVSTDIVFETVNGAGLGSLNTDQLRLKFDGSTRIGTTATYVEIDSGADFTFVGAGSGFPYAEIWVLGNAVATGIGGAGVFVQFTGFVNDGSFNNCTPDHTNDHITIIEPGDYLCVCSFHIESIGAGAADTVSIEIRKNNGTVVFNNLHAHRKLAGGGGDIGSISISGALPGVSNGDTIEVWLTNDDNATDILVADANLTISQIGGD